MHTAAINLDSEAKAALCIHLQHIYMIGLLMQFYCCFIVPLMAIIMHYGCIYIPPGSRVHQWTLYSYNAKVNDHS